MDRNALNEVYENIGLICYQWTHFISDFENEFSKKSELDRAVYETVKETLETNLADTYTTSELIFNIINAEEDSELINYLENAKGEVT